MKGKPIDDRIPSLDEEFSRAFACGMTEDEAICWGAVFHAASLFFDLPVLHQNDDEEVTRAVHILQDKLLARPAYRKYLELEKKNKEADDAI